MANVKVRNEPEDFKQVVKASWLRRWKALLACAAARAFALSLLERRCAPGCDGPTPSSDEVVRAHRYEAWWLGCPDTVEIDGFLSPG